MDEQRSSQHAFPVVVTVSIVLVRMLSIGPELLLVQRSMPPFFGYWALPNGILAEADVSLESAAARVLREETGLVLPGPLWLRQLRSYGDRYRDPRPGRWISVAFYAPIIHRPRWQDIKSGFPSSGGKAQWWPVNEIPPLAFDHQTIADQAFEPGRLHIVRRFY